jgi:hypothetical protein
MATTMKAGVVHAFGKPLTIEEVPIPTPGPGEVLIKGHRHRRLPHRPACRRWRLGGQAAASVYPRP